MYRLSIDQEFYSNEGVISDHEHESTVGALFNLDDFPIQRDRVLIQFQLQSIEEEKEESV